jgi:EmrB/QacA subfamily drug resistance transporter
MLARLPGCFQPGARRTMLAAMPDQPLIAPPEADHPAPPADVDDRPASGSGMRATALIVACALLMQNLDSTVVATALPAMAKAFGADPVRMNLALTSYMLSLAVFVPASGWMADRFGSRRVFRAAIVVFTLGSILCGRAGSLGFLVGARILQGMGGAMMLPVGRLLLLRSVQKSEIVAAMAWLTMPALLGPVLGPPVGGFITTYWSWRWIFDINVPIGAAGVVLVSLFIRDVREPKPNRFDGWGLALSGMCLAGLMFGFETAGRGAIPAYASAALLGIGFACGIGYWRHARRHPHPVLDLSLLRIPTFGVSVCAGSLFRIGIGAIPFLLPMMLQLGFGDSAAQSGLITFASAAGAILMKPAATWALRVAGFRPTLVWNAVLSALLLAACAAFRPGWPVVGIYAVLLLGGFFRSLQFTAYNALAYADIPRERMSAATAAYSTFQQLFLTTGIAIGAASLEFTSRLGGHATPTFGDFSLAFLVVALFSITAAPASLLMPREAGAELSGHVTRLPRGGRAL